MFPVLVTRPLCTPLRRLTVVAGLAVALAGTIGSAVPASAQYGAYYCASGGTSVGCAFGGSAGAAVAGSVDVDDPAMTLAAGYGGVPGCPGTSVAADIDLSDYSMDIAGAVGGNVPYSSAGAVVGTYP